MINKFLNNEKISIYGKGNDMREWTFVQDNCEAILFVSTKGKVGETYNISSGIEMSNIDFAKLVASLMGKLKEEIEMIEDRKGHDYRYSITTEKIRALAWYYKTSLKTGLIKTINYYKNKQKS